MTCEQCQKLKAEISTLRIQLADVELLLHSQLRNSRFDYNARYIRFDEAEKVPEFQHITKALASAKNFVPFEVGNWVAYRRGTSGLYLYFVPVYDFRVPRERKKHKEM